MPASIFSLCSISDTYVDDLGAPVVGLEFDVAMQTQSVSGQPLAYNVRRYVTDQNGKLVFNAVQGALMTVQTRPTPFYLAAPYTRVTTFTVPNAATGVLRTIAPNF